MLRYGSFVIDYPEYLYLMIPLLILLIFLMRKRFINEEHRLFSKKAKRLIIFILKVLFFLALCIALSSPVLEEKETHSKITKIKVLIDGSNSMKLYDTLSVQNTLSKIEGITINTKFLDMGDYSSLGSALLASLSPGENILIVTDGQNNFGPELEDVMLFASSIGSRVFGMNLDQSKSDARIIIEGPSKVVSEVENTFTISVKEVGNIGKKIVKIYLDEQLIYDAAYDKPVEITRKFSSGSHIFKAVLETGERDFFPENNIFYKAVTVHSKPSVLLVGDVDSPLEELLRNFYALETSSNLIKGEYYAIIFNNVNANSLSAADIEWIDDYVADGNGFFVIGGRNAYDWGNYNNSLLSGILPVSVGQARKRKDITHVAILMDTGASAAELLEELTHFDIQKSLAADIVSSLASSNRVALLEANYYLNTISPLSELGPKREQLIRDISYLRAHGMSELRFAYQKAHDMLRLNRGTRSIVILTDGNLIPVDQSTTLQYVERAFNDGIKTFIIGVGEKADEDFLIQIKERGGGEYFRADERSRIKLYFGNPEDIPETDLRVFAYDSNHFITRDLKELGEIYGYNKVYPKSTARLLLTTSAGDPVLTVWNYGLGRVAALSSDDGSSWIPDMLAEENSIVLIRTLNWLIEDPERKSELRINIPELRVGENSIITVISPSYPESGLNFYEAEKGVYKASIYPEEEGIVNLLGVPGAVNYKKELLNIGINNELEKTLAISGGEMLDNDADKIREKLSSVSPVESMKRIDLSWAFVFLAMALYLIELLLRRIFEVRQQR